MTSAEIHQRVSVPRLSPYLNAAGSVDNALALYRWNSAMSASLFELVGHAEVVLRNALADELTNLRTASGDSTGAWFWADPQGPPWFQPWWQPEMIKNLNRARSKAKDATGTVRPGKVVAELTFGFWRYLLTAHYEASLWTPALRYAFPQRIARSTVYDLVEKINILRNRVAHHEPIYRRNLQTDISRIEQLLDWISPDTSQWAFDKVETQLYPLLAANPF
jgi:Abi-like protein